MNKNTLYLISKLTALLGVTVMQFMADVDIIFAIISMLAFSCLFLTDFLVDLIKKKPVVTAICTALCVLGSLYLGIDFYLPVVIFSLMHLIDTFTKSALYWQICAVVMALIVLVFPPKMTAMLMIFVMLVLFALAREAIIKLEGYKEIADELRVENSASKKKIAEMNSYTKTLREMTAMEERNRFASKIHDELGHSISGSIILLEGARLNMTKNPEQAEKSISTAVENLRVGVDNIRHSLHEERPAKHTLGISEIKEKLGNFRVSYNKETALDIDGDVGKISIGIWICLQENLTEALTNMIKHSNGTKFTVKIAVHNKVIRVQFSDNGENYGVLKKGMGLESIEERTCTSGGKCLFQSTNKGFFITCIFMI